MLHLWCIYVFVFLQTQCFGQIDECIRKLFTSLELIDLVYVKDQVELLRNASLKAPFTLAAQQLHLIRIVAMEMLELEFWKQPGGTALVLNRASVDLEVMFEVAWKHYLTDLVVVAQNSSIYTYAPLSGGRCPNLDPVYLGTCKGFTMLPRKKFDFSGCTIKLPYLYTPAIEMDWNSEDDPGIVLKQQKELMKVLRYKVELYNFSEYGVLLRNGTYTGMFRGVQDGNIDFVIGAFTNDSYMSDFDLVSAYFSTYYYFYAPIALNIVPWKNLFIVFELQLWFAFLATFALVVLSCSLLKSKEVGSYKSFSYCILALWRIIYTVNCSMPKTPQLKFTVVLWIFAAFLLSSAYQAYMHSCLFMPRPGYQIDTVEKVVSSGMSYGGSIYAKDAYDKIDTEISRKFVRNYVLCSMLHECIDRTAEKRDFIVVKDLRTVFWNWKNYLDKKGKPKLYRFPSEAAYMVAVYLRKGNPVKEEMQAAILRFYQGGLLQRWDKYNTIQDYAQRKAVYGQLKPEQLLAAFVMFMIGLAMASIGFLFETWLTL